MGIKDTNVCKRRLLAFMRDYNHDRKSEDVVDEWSPVDQAVSICVSQFRPNCGSHSVSRFFTHCFSIGFILRRFPCVTTPRYTLEMFAKSGGKPKELRVKTWEEIRREKAVLIQVKNQEALRASGTELPVRTIKNQSTAVPRLNRPEVMKPVTLVRKGLKQNAIEDEVQESPCKHTETPSQGSCIAVNSPAKTEIAPAKETPTTSPSKSYIDKLMDEFIGYIDNEVEMKVDPSKSIEDFLLEPL